MSLSYIWAVNVPPVNPVQLHYSLKKKKNLLKFYLQGTWDHSKSALCDMLCLALMDFDCVHFIDLNLLR